VVILQFIVQENALKLILSAHLSSKSESHLIILIFSRNATCISPVFFQHPFYKGEGVSRVQNISQDRFKYAMQEHLISQHHIKQKYSAVL